MQLASKIKKKVIMAEGVSPIVVDSEESNSITLRADMHNDKVFKPSEVIGHHHGLHFMLTVWGLSRGMKNGEPIQYGTLTEFSSATMPCQNRFIKMLF